MAKSDLLDITQNGFMKTTGLAVRYGVSSDTIRMWRRNPSFPKAATKKIGTTTYWNVDMIDAWLRARKISHTGRPPQWLEVVNHPALESGTKISGKN